MQLSYFQAQMLIRHREQERREIEQRNQMLRAARLESPSVHRSGLIGRLFRGRAATSVVEKRETSLATA